MRYAMRDTHPVGPCTCASSPLFEAVTTLTDLSVCAKCSAAVVRQEHENKIYIKYKKAISYILRATGQKNSGHEHGAPGPGRLITHAKEFNHNADDGVSHARADTDDAATARERRRLTEERPTAKKKRERLASRPLHGAEKREGFDGDTLKERWRHRGRARPPPG